MLVPELLAGMAVVKGPSSSQLFPPHFPCAPWGMIHWENAEGNGWDHSLLTNATFCQGNFTESREIQFIPE